MQSKDPVSELFIKAALGFSLTADEQNLVEERQRYIEQEMVKEMVRHSHDTFVSNILAAKDKTEEAQ